MQSETGLTGTKFPDSQQILRRLHLAIKTGFSRQTHVAGGFHSSLLPTGTRQDVLTRSLGAARSDGASESHWTATTIALAADSTVPELRNGDDGPIQRFKCDSSRRAIRPNPDPNQSHSLISRHGSDMVIPSMPH